MRRILIYENRKTDPVFWDATTPELEAGAVLALFKHLDKDWQVYAGLTEGPYIPERPKDHVEGCMCEPCQSHRKATAAAPKEERQTAEHLALYKAAKKGDADAALKLLTARKDWEYESFKFVWADEVTGENYAPRTWGETKPCSTVYVTDDGLVRWEQHERVRYNLYADKKAAIAYLTKQFRFESRGEVQPEEPWTLTDRMNAEPEFEKRAKALIAEKTLKPKKAAVLIQKVCGGCRREIERFDPPEMGRRKR